MDLQLLAFASVWSVSFRIMHHPLVWLLILAILGVIALATLGVIALVLLRSGRK